MAQAWTGFTRLGYHEIKSASNGDFGYELIEKRRAAANGTLDVLGLTMTETTLGQSLSYDRAADRFYIDLEQLAKYAGRGLTGLGV